MPRGRFQLPCPRRTWLVRLLGALPALLLAGATVAPPPLVAQAPESGGEPGPRPPVASPAPPSPPPLSGTRSASRPGDGETPGGLWWSAGVGAGTLRFTCDLCARGRDSGPSVFAQVGAWAGPALRVALEGGGWTRDDGGVRETLYRAGLTGFYHPDPDRGLHLLAGLAWVGHRAEDTRYDSAALSVGAGWDLPLLPGWTVGNAVRIDAASFGSFRVGDERVAEDVGLSLVRFEVTLGRSTRSPPEPL